MTPRGTNLIRIEPLDGGINMSGHTPTRATNTNQTPTKTYQNLNQSYRPSENIVSTPSRLMSPSRTPTRAGYSPGGVYKNRVMNPYNYTPGGTQIQTKVN